MQIYFICPRWGSENLQVREFVKKARFAGYDGAEFSLPADPVTRYPIVKTFREEGFLYLGQHWETVTTDFADHKKQYKARLENLLRGDPILIDSQTGRDFFTFEQNSELIETAAGLSRKSGVEIVHETHRGKFSFAAHIMKHYLEMIPDLRIGADLSHWCNVAESLLEDQEEALELAISRTDHIHARVGFQEGPQIPDPRAPEWDEILQRHMGWWDRIIARVKEENRNFFTITPEFGPFPYMTILPGSTRPIADQWDINVFMMNLLRERYC